ncbi:hypothetical protein [Martelella soudanensis]|nr:hypothetical protein [Martelella sp. NC18]
MVEGVGNIGPICGFARIVRACAIFLVFRSPVTRYVTRYACVTP